MAEYRMLTVEEILKIINDRTEYLQKDIHDNKNRYARGCYFELMRLKNAIMHSGIRIDEDDE